MSRPHIDFVQTQRLPWEPGLQIGRPDLSIKVLSFDAVSKAISCIVRFPAGWSVQREWLSVDEEFFVLDGAIEINGRLYRDHTYASFPAGYVRERIATKDGAVVIAFFSGKPAILTGTAYGAPPKDGLVEFMDLTDNIWDADLESMGLAPMRQGAQMRVLKKHPKTGETTYVTATIAFRRGNRAERHPVIQEFYLLAGELAGDRGIMQAGAYCVRPPMAKHAPYGSKTGALIFFRSLGGPQSTHWEDADPFTFAPAHTPILPVELEPFGAPIERPPRY